MRKLFVLATVAVLSIPTQGRSIGATALEMHCAEAIAAGGTNLVANVRCIYHLIDDRLNDDLCPFCRQ